MVWAIGSALRQTPSAPRQRPAHQPHVVGDRVDQDAVAPLGQLLDVVLGVGVVTQRQVEHHHVGVDVVGQELVHVLVRADHHDPAAGVLLKRGPDAQPDRLMIVDDRGPDGGRIGHVFLTVTVPASSMVVSYAPRRPAGW